MCPPTDSVRQKGHLVAGRPRGDPTHFPGTFSHCSPSDQQLETSPDGSDYEPSCYRVLTTDLSAPSDYGYGMASVPTAWERCRRRATL